MVIYLRKIEHWRDVVGYEGRYQVSDMGRVRSFLKNENGIILSQNLSNKGYFRACLYNNKGERKEVGVHRLVAIAHVPNPDNLPIINHKDRNPKLNYIENIEWCTYSYNSKYAFILRPELSYNRSGELSPNAKSSNQDVLEIYNMAWDGINQKEIAKKYNTTRRNVNNIQHGKTWNSVTHHNESLKLDPDKYAKTGLRISKVIRAKICKTAQETELSQIKLSKMFNITRKTIGDILRESGIKTKFTEKHSKIYETQSKICQLATTEKLTITEIAKECNVNIATVYKILKQNNINYKILKQNKINYKSKHIPEDPTDLDYWL